MGSKTAGKTVVNPAKKDAYLAKLKQIYANIPPTNAEKAGELMSRLADVLVMMDECRDGIAADGLVVSMPQGNYSINRENPYSKIYDAKHKLMLLTVDHLDKMLPDEGSGRDELMEFLSK